jgi:hypothetical protein
MEAFGKALEIQRSRYGPDHPHIAMTLSNRARLLRDEGKLDEAAADARASLEMRRRLLGEQHPKVAASQKQLEEIVALQRKQTTGHTDASTPPSIP